MFMLNLKKMNMKNLLLLALSLICCICSTSVAVAQVKQLECPYYIYPRASGQHIDLSLNWMLCSTVQPVKELNELDRNEWLSVAYPTSVQMAHFKAGKLGDPYKHLNAREHEKLEQKVWYYRKKFVVPPHLPGNNLLLNFDGIDYYAKVWLNGVELGQHQGVFGGPIIDVSQTVKYGEENDLLVEVISANYGIPEFNPNVPGKIVKGWFLTGGSAMEPFFNMGLWRDVRLEVIPKYHIERPFLYTKSIDGDKATIGFEIELFAGKNSLDYQLHPWNNCQISNFSIPAQSPQNKKIREQLEVVIELLDKDKVAYSKTFSPEVIEGRCWMEDCFTLENPKLWYPNGLGNQDYYLAKISLKAKGKTIDCIQFDFGVRTIEQVRSAGIRTDDRWQDWQFVVNGKRLFVKGINWMPVDALYDLTADKYDWAVKMAWNAGIQMFRIWGSGLMESEEFYEACNKYGIMVWQDFNIANFDTPEWPQEVWEAQVCQNIFRLRNQPSLAVWCGGNEFNPYSYGNAATIGILERNLKIFDPTRCFLRTSPDAGSMHSYPDFDPSWYKGFDLVPYIAETGIHCITDPAGIREVVAEAELIDLRGMYEETFATKHPEFVEHFAEYNPSRVPRMLSRASHIDNMANPSLESIAEASQVGAGEFYQVMSEGIQRNYPATTGLMPWVYKRPWPVVAAINLVDGMGQPSATYYFLKRTYEPIHVSLDIKRLLWASGEKFPVSVDVMNGVGQSGFEGSVEVRILDECFKDLWQESKAITVQEGTAITSKTLGIFDIPSVYKKKYFFAVAVLRDHSGKVVSQSEYWPRTIKSMEESHFHKKYSTEPVAWPTLNEGPWLKPTVAKSKTSIEVSELRVNNSNGKDATISFNIKNKGQIPSFMTHVDVKGVSRLFFANDNYFWLSPGETKEIVMQVQIKENKPMKLIVSGWNIKSFERAIKL